MFVRVRKQEKKLNKKIKEDKAFKHEISDEKFDYYFLKKKNRKRKWTAKKRKKIALAIKEKGFEVVNAEKVSKLFELELEKDVEKSKKKKEELFDLSDFK